MNFMTSRQEDPELKATRALIDRETLVPLSAAVALIVLCFSAFMWLSHQFESITTQNDNNYQQMKDDLKDFSYRIKSVEEKLKEPTDVWTGHKMQMVLLRWKANNPTLNVPDVTDLVNDKR